MLIDIINTSSYPLPQYETVGSAGLDLRADMNKPITLNSLDRICIPTGIAIALPIGYEAQVRPRSGLALKHGITVIDSPGTIDSDYRGIIHVPLINLSKEPFTVYPGERIGQLIISKHEKVEWNEVDKLSETERGTGGFGHTGIN